MRARSPGGLRRRAGRRQALEWCAVCRESRNAGGRGAWGAAPAVCVVRRVWLARHPPVHSTSAEHQRPCCSEQAEHDREAGADTRVCPVERLARLCSRGGIRPGEDEVPSRLACTATLARRFGNGPIR